MDDFIGPEQLVELMGTMTLGKDLQIVDARDDDREVGWIKGSVNLPSRTLNADVMSNFARSIAGSATLVVFHCQLSQVRGPAARRLFEGVASNVFTQAPRPRTVILRGGFGMFQSYAMQNCPHLLEQ